MRSKRSVGPVHYSLPRPIVLPRIPLTLSIIADVRALVHKRLPPSYKSKQSWQQVGAITAAVAQGQLPAEEVAIAVRLVLSMEGVACR